MTAQIHSTTTTWTRFVLTTAVGVCSVIVILQRRRRAIKRTTSGTDDVNDSICCFGAQQKEEDCSSSSSFIYMDYNGTTPIYPIVFNAMIPYLTKYYGNPGSTHCAGDEPHRAIQQARYQILKYLFHCPSILPLVEKETATTTTDVVAVVHTDTDRAATTTAATTTDDDDDVPTTPLSSCIFTSCGTEADNLMIHIAIQLWTLRNTKSMSTTTTTTTCDDEIQQQQQQQQPQLPHIVTTNIEHPAIDLCLRMYEQQHRCTVTRVPVQSDGRVTVADVIDAIQSNIQNTILVTIMLANNEMGAIQPIQDICTFCRTNQILFGTDAAQATGKISITLSDLHCHPDMIIVVGHKFGTPKGIGCMYLRPNCLYPYTDQIHGLLIGGGQEYHWRGGTSNVPYIVGLGVAAVYTNQHLLENAEHMEMMRTRLLQHLIRRLGKSNVRVHGPEHTYQRLPNTLSIGFGNGIHSGTLLHDLRNVVAASAGATCHSGSDGPVSSILQAMDIPDSWARGTVRFSLGPQTTSEEVDRSAIFIADAVHRQWNKNKRIC